MMRFHSRTFDKSFLACYTDTVRTDRTEKEVIIMAKRIFCEYNVDTACVEIKYDKRIIFSNDGLIYCTDDHYESFEQLYDGWED